MANAIQQIDDRRAAQAIAHPQTGQAIGLGEGAADEQVGKTGQPGDGVVALLRPEVFGVSLVEHHQNLGRHLAQEGLDPVAGKEGACRVVGIGNEDHPRGGSDRRQHGIQVMAEVLRWHLDTTGARRLGGQGVDRKGVAGIDGFAIRTEKSPGGQLKDIVGTVAENDLIQGHTVTPVQGILQLEAVAVGVAGNVCQRRLNGRPGLLADAQRVLVGGQLDDGRLRQPHLPGQFGDRLAGLIGRDRPDVGGRQITQTHEQLQGNQYTAWG